ncbi:hypothetical protein K2X33_04370 [bacterium]|nr:hypothetical protein [bacterium]
MDAITNHAIRNAETVKLKRAIDVLLSRIPEEEIDQIGDFEDVKTLVLESHPQARLEMREANIPWIRIRLDAQTDLAATYYHNGMVLQLIESLSRMPHYFKTTLKKALPKRLADRVAEKTTGPAIEQELKFFPAFWLRGRGTSSDLVFLGAVAKETDEKLPILTPSPTAFTSQTACNELIVDRYTEVSGSSTPVVISWRVPEP